MCRIFESTKYHLNIVKGGRSINYFEYFPCSARLCAIWKPCCYLPQLSISSIVGRD